MPYDLKLTHFSLVLQKNVATGYVVDREGVVVRSVLEDGGERVMKADGSAATYDRRLRHLGQRDDRHHPNVEDFTIPASPGPYTVQLAYTSSVGTAPNSSIRVKNLVAGTGITEVVGSPNTGEFKPENTAGVLNGLLTFNSAQAGVSIRVWYRANITVAQARQRYFQRNINNAADTSIDITGSANKTGWLNAIYAERQWYANNGAQFDKTYRLWFSDTSDPETVDLTPDGDWIPISSTSEIPEPVKGLAPCYNSLLVFKATETFAVYGNSPSSFSAKKMHDDGVLSTMSIQTWGGGAIWAGAGGIYFFDGITVANLTSEKLGDAWKNSIRTVDPTRYRMWSMMARDHYFLYIENLAPTVSVQRGITSKTPTRQDQIELLHGNHRQNLGQVLPAKCGFTAKANSVTTSPRMRCCWMMRSSTSGVQE